MFCRLWLVNRTEMVLQHRGASLAMAVDATFMGDRMPQVGAAAVHRCPAESGDAS